MTTGLLNVFRSRLDRFLALPRDDRGSISVMSVITIFVLTIVLGMVINAGRQVDEKVRLQNAADAATYSGGVVMARGLNALAFSNHVEAEVFALVAYMRTGHVAGPGNDSTTLNFVNGGGVKGILDAWNNVGQIFSNSSFPKFAALGRAIQQKVPLEKDVVQTFLQMTELQSSLVLGPLESILLGPTGKPDPLGGNIPRFQRTLVQTIPQTAQLAASEIAQMHGQRWQKQHQTQPLTAVLWRPLAPPDGAPKPISPPPGIRSSMGNEQDPLARTMPVFDPSPTGQDLQISNADPGGDYLEVARCQRRIWASWLLELWNRNLLDPFWRGIPSGGGSGQPNLSYPWWQPNAGGIPGEGPGGAGAAKASALYWIWEIYSCAQLNKLLDTEYYGTNVPFVYRVPNDTNVFHGQAKGNCQLQPELYDCACLTRSYESLMRINVDPTQSNTLEQYHTFVGVVYWPRMSQTSPVFFRYPLATDAMAFAQVSVFIPAWRYRCCPWAFPIYSNSPQFGGQIVDWADNRDNWPPWWDTTNQSWAARLVPATSDSVPTILQSPMAQQFAPNVRVPNLGGIAPATLRRINTH